MTGRTKKKAQKKCKYQDFFNDIKIKDQSFNK